MSILIFLLALVSAALHVTEASSPSCARSMHGHILAGNTCKFKCCLNGRVETMKLSLETCSAFRSRGKGCIESGLRFPHRSVIKFNPIACYICYNGMKVKYYNPGFKSGSRVTDYTLVRFG